ncbi:MAG TPA: hypothetical protein VJZ70_03815 [Limnochordia bacterium]|nr:hypothetical protein [Limnochordia bacterium]
MLLRIMRVMMVIGLLLFITPTTLGQAHAWKMVHGDVLQVSVDQHKILVDVGGESKIFVLEEDCQILRLGVPTSLDSLRPVTEEAFQDVLCWLNGQGRVAYVLANYSVSEEDGTLVAYDIFGNPK